MNIAYKILLIIFLSASAWALEIDAKSSNIALLPHSMLYIDKTNTLTKDEVEKGVWTKTSKEALDFGIVPDTAVWVKFTLKNNSNETLKKTLEYDNQETESILFFDGKRVIQEGMFHHVASRSSINPIFKITLAPFEKRTFYIKASCKISTMVVKLTLWNKFDFLDDDARHKLYIFLFFTVIGTLLLYNFMLYVFTSDRVYFYYISYLAAMMIFESIYLGVAQLYFFSNALSTLVTQATIGYIVMLVLPMILFTMEFLDTKRFKKLHIVLKVYLYILPFIALLSFDNFIFDLNVMLIFFPLAVVMIVSAFYSLYHGTKEAIIYLFGWSIVIISLTLSVLQSLGGYNIFEDFPYINEVAFALEALLFSIALAYRIKLLNLQKNIADKKLIHFQREEAERLEFLVAQKTEALQKAVEEKEILYRELNHRVKNNLQMVLSLIQLQISLSSSENTQKELIITKNRINSIAKLYELLYFKKSAESFKTENYFREIVHSIEENFDLDVTVEYDIQDEICIKSSIYCGLIVNELVTNSFKYAFDEKGKITLRTYKKDGYVYLYVADNGRGFVQDTTQSLGLIIVKTLTKKQLNAEVIIESDDGVKSTIYWKEDRDV